MANIWVAASDGDTARVQELLATGISANVKDENSYTPIHAAASYGHLETLDVLLQHGGDINLTDDDGDTPIYTAETTATGRYLVEHGAIIDRLNNEGISPIEHLEEDYPEVADYLRSVLQGTSDSSQPIPPHPAPPSQYLQNAASDQLTDNLMAALQNIDPQSQVPVEQQIEDAVGKTVLDGVLAGYQLSQNGDDQRHDSERNGITKKPRTDEN